MILWALLYLSFGSSFALPTPSDTPIHISPSLFARDADIFGTRSIWSIIWSCFSTIFACTWIAVHPNIPAPKDTQWAVLRRRLVIMGYVLIAPEMVIFWAARQHWAAKYFAKRHQKRGWTMSHTFFMNMGGFTLHDEQGIPLRILEPEELENLSASGRIEWPSITKAEIQDRSKGDHLSKGIVLIQTSWFIIQCVVRGAYRLEVTELEVTTLAFAVLTGIMYYLWWHKPIDVRCSVPVYLLKDDKRDRVDSQNMSSVSPVADPANITPIISCDLNSNWADSQSSPIPEETQTPQQSLDVISDLEFYFQEPSQSSHDNSTPSPEVQSTRIQQFFAFIQRQRQEHGAVLGLAHIFFLYPLRSFTHVFTLMAVSNTLDDFMPHRVPSFYSPRVITSSGILDRNWQSATIAMIVAIVFGSIHCVAWSSHFPTLQEKLAWRISAASVAGLPILFLVIAMLSFGNYIASAKWQKIRKALPFMPLSLSTSYVIARIVLLILPCIALRALNPAALVDIQWTAFFPHIG